MIEKCLLIFASRSCGRAQLNSAILAGPKSRVRLPGLTMPVSEEMMEKLAQRRRQLAFGSLEADTVPPAVDRAGANHTAVAEVREVTDEKDRDLATLGKVAAEVREVTAVGVGKERDPGAEVRADLAAPEAQHRSPPDGDLPTDLAESGVASEEPAQLQVSKPQEIAIHTLGIAIFTPRDLRVPEMKSCSRRTRRGFKVRLHIYDVSHDLTVQRLNRILANQEAPLKLGGIFHAGIEVNKTEWAFGCESVSEEIETGVKTCQPKQNPQHHYRQTASLGRTILTREEVAAVLASMAEEYSAESYDLLHRNCCHFADELCLRLGVKRPPRWLLRLAKLGAAGQKQIRLLAALALWRFCFVRRLVEAAVDQLLPAPIRDVMPWQE
ncbi:unnamed protein product [Effrenium voratum]|nr:unnamed protein product [Effrenium voratum]